MTLFAPRRSIAFPILSLLALTANAVAWPTEARAQVVKWAFEATVVDLVDPRGVFPGASLGDHVTGTFAWHVAARVDPEYLPELGGYFHPAWFLAAAMNVHNPATNEILRFTSDHSGEISTDVIVTNDFDAEDGLGPVDSLLVTQPVLPPNGFLGIAPFVAVTFAGPPTTIVDVALPTSLNLDDWNVGLVTMFDLFATDDDDTTITAEIFAVTPVALAAGDFTADGAVDAADLAAWQEEFGIDEGAFADADGDGNADGADFLAWQRQFGGAAAVLSVPEPAGGAVALLALVAIRRGFSCHALRRTSERATHGSR